METIIAQNVGVDIGKAILDVHLHPAGTARRFTNDAKGIDLLLGWLAGYLVVRVVFEPTGRYHRAFERRLGGAGLPLAKVNPRQARRFAEAIGCNAKTDAVDAAMLARMGALLELVKDRTTAKNREHVCRSPLLKRHAAQRLARIDRQIAAIDAELKVSLTREPGLTARIDVLAIGHCAAARRALPGAGID